jgi:hypothetical protein
MEEIKNKIITEKKDQEIVFTKAVKAGKRIYYLDVKKNRNDELFLAITESKKIVGGTINEPVVTFEKHKIFLYKEDFENFMNSLRETIAHINDLPETPSYRKEMIPKELLNDPLEIVANES